MKGYGMKRKTILAMIFNFFACLASAHLNSNYNYDVVDLTSINHAVGADCRDQSDYTFPGNCCPTCLEAQTNHAMKNAICNRADPNSNLPVAFFCPIVCDALAISKDSCIDEYGQYGFRLLKCLRNMDSYYGTWYTSIAEWNGKWVHTDMCFSAISSHNVQNPGIPHQDSGFPPQIPEIPNQNPGTPSQNPGIPHQDSGFPPQIPEIPHQNPGTPYHTVIPIYYPERHSSSKSRKSYKSRKSRKRRKNLR